ncbi:hypothetical protein E3G52_000343 [Mycobacteroides abscessus]|nr:hypothetical protein [Mycobacteroides abscessus]
MTTTRIATSVPGMGALMGEDVAHVRDAIWSELERQAQRFGCVDRDHSLIDMNGIELDMDKVAAAAIHAVRANDQALVPPPCRWERVQPGP